MIKEKQQQKKNSYASKNLLKKKKRKDYRFRKEHHLAITDPTNFLRSVRGETFLCLLSTKEPRFFVYYCCLAIVILSVPCSDLWLLLYTI